MFLLQVLAIVIVILHDMAHVAHSRIKSGTILHKRTVLLRSIAIGKSSYSFGFTRSISPEVMGCNGI